VGERGECARRHPAGRGVAAVAAGRKVVRAAWPKSIAHMRMARCARVRATSRFA
jgi:hypothetical protein